MARLVTTCSAAADISPFFAAEDPSMSLTLIAAGDPRPHRQPLQRESNTLHVHAGRQEVPQETHDEIVASLQARVRSEDEILKRLRAAIASLEGTVASLVENVTSLTLQ